jgi:hypothetical protein
MANADRAALIAKLKALPRRYEPLGGQQFSYVKLDDVLAIVEQAALRDGPAETPAPQCESSCNPHVARCGAKFCTFEELMQHQRVSHPAGAEEPR